MESLDRVERGEIVGIWRGSFLLISNLVAAAEVAAL